MGERERRIGVNEAVFRRVNERLRDLNEAFSAITDTVDIVCECGNASCVERITMATSEYEQLREDPELFVVVPGHAAPDVETTIDRRDGYEVVRKGSGPPRRIAHATDPR